MDAEQAAHPITLPFLDGEGMSSSEHLEAESEVSSEHLRSNASGQTKVVEIVKTSGKINQAMVQEAILFLCSKRFTTLNELATQLNRAPTTLRTHYISELTQQGRLVMRYPDKPNHPNQAYRVPD